MTKRAVVCAPYAFISVHVRPTFLISIAFIVSLVTACDSRTGIAHHKSIVDTIAPSTPKTLAANEVTPNQITVEWGAATDNVGVSEYQLYLDEQLVSETEETEFSITQLSPATNYTLRVRAVDEAANESEFSDPIEVKTLEADPSMQMVAAVVSEPPTAPSNLRTTSVGSNQVTLYWTPSTDDVRVASYQVFDKQNLVTTSSAARAQIRNLTAETTYHFSVRAIDDMGNISDPSSTLAVTTRGLTIQVTQGETVYTDSCAICHGVDGKGVGTNVGVTRALSVAELTTIVDQTMPPAAPATCVGDCAASVAQYIYDTFTDKSSTSVTNPLAGFPTGAAQIANVCARATAANRGDVVTTAFCGTSAPQITSLVQLQTAIGLNFVNTNGAGRRNNGGNGNPAFALTGHSTSLVSKQVNAVNPRALIFTPVGRRQNAPAGFVAMGFVRGDLFAEIVAADPNNNNALTFYLAKFTLACNANDACTPGELLTPAIESNWTSFTLYDDVDLANTVVDCLQCHQTGGPATVKTLRMQELAVPWSHWLRSNTASSVLIDDFRAAHGTTETYAGIPGNLISASDPRLLENLVRSSGARQANQFNSRQIEREVRASSPAQPANNTVPGVSATWAGIYANAVSAQAIGVPYHDIKVTDPAVLPNLIQSYQSFLTGATTASELPDLRDAFYTAQLRDIGFKVKAGLNGAGIILQACGQCHNSDLNQNINRARFNVNLNAMSNTAGGILSAAERNVEIGTAITRLQMPPNDVRNMPPQLFRTLDATEIDSAIRYLCSQTTQTISQCAGF